MSRNAYAIEQQDRLLKAIQDLRFETFSDGVDFLLGVIAAERCFVMGDPSGAIVELRALVRRLERRKTAKARAKSRNAALSDAVSR